MAEGDDEQLLNIAGQGLPLNSCSRSTRSQSRSHGHSSRAKKSVELVESDEEMEDVVEMRMTKGKGRSMKITWRLMNQPIPHHWFDLFPREHDDDH